MLDGERETADRGPVATCILQQRLGLGYPHVLAAPAQPLVEDDGGNLTALAGTGAVAKEESGPVRATVLVRRERQPFLGRLEQTGDVALESVTGVDQRFELSVGQHPFVDYPGRQLRNVRRPRCGNRANGEPMGKSWWRERGCKT